MEEFVGLFRSKKQRVLELRTPAPGVVVAMADVPDPVFAGNVVGPGFAVEPTDGLVRSPITGTLGGILPSKHAFFVVTDEGVQVLVHAGLETVTLKGENFTIRAEVGTHVLAGQPILEWDVEAVREAGFATVIPVCLVKMGPYSEVRAETGRKVEAGQVAATVVRG